MKIRYVIASLLLSAIIITGSNAAPPRTIGFTGILTDAAGKPKPNGNYAVTFRLYDSLAGPNVLWTEPNKQVSVSGGHGGFSTVLGDPTPFGLAFDNPYYLELQVSGEANPMAPRVALQAAPYALNAGGGGGSLSLPYSGSASVAAPAGAFTVTNTGTGAGLFGQSTTSTGTAGKSSSGSGTTGQSDTWIGVYGLSGSGEGVHGDSTSGSGVVGKSNAWIGTYGESATNTGVWGRGITGNGVYGSSDGAGIGVFGESASFEGVRGQAHDVNHGAVVGVHLGGGYGVFGTSSGAGVVGVSTNWIGTYGESNVFDGVQGVSHANGHAGVAGISTANGFGVYGRSDGGGYAGWFDGHVHLNVLEIAGGSDLAEKFDVSGQADPGTVMCIDPDHPGKLRVAAAAYDTTVAGVVSGANGLGVGIVLPDATASKTATPLAMSGRVWVKCDAGYGPIRPGDLLTTSETPGFAMRVSDHSRSQGATLGKAMTPLTEGRGVVMALVSLQ